MKRGQEEERGRFLLRGLLWLVLLSALVAQGLPLAPLDGARLLLLGCSLLPLCAVLWSVHRGSYPALALLALGAVQELGRLADLLRYGGAEAFGGPAQGAAVIALLLRVLAVGAAWTPSAASGYLAGRRGARTRRDLFLELGLFAAALLAEFLVWRFLMFALW